MDEQSLGYRSLEETGGEARRQNLPAEILNVAAVYCKFLISINTFTSIHSVCTVIYLLTSKRNGRTAQVVAFATKN